MLLSQTLILIFGICLFANAFLPGFGFCSLILVLSCIPCLGLDFLLIILCCPDPHGLTKFLVLCSLCILFRLSHQHHWSRVLTEKTVRFSVNSVIQKLPIILVNLLDCVLYLTLWTLDCCVICTKKFLMRIPSSPWLISQSNGCYSFYSSLLTCGVECMVL